MKRNDTDVKFLLLLVVCCRSLVKFTVMSLRKIGLYQQLKLHKEDKVFLKLASKDAREESHLEVEGSEEASQLLKVPT